MRKKTMVDSMKTTRMEMRGEIQLPVYEFDGQDINDDDPVELNFDDGEMPPAPTRPPFMLPHIDAGYHLRKIAICQGVADRIRRPKGGAVEAQNQRAELKGTLGTISPKEWARWKVCFGDACAYCGKCLFGGGVIEHFVPLSLGGLNHISNVFPACKLCNMRKGSKEPWGWLERAKLRTGFEKRRDTAIARFNGKSPAD